MARPRASPIEPVLDGRFLLLEWLGSGGMGSVYRAFDRIENDEVAVKVLDAEGRAGPAHPLSAEFETWARLEHPNVVRAIELGRARSGPFPGGRPYLVLEYFPGRPAHREPPPRGRAQNALEEIAAGALRGLDHVHREGLVHRDVKPGNVLVARSSTGSVRVKVTDFGLAAGNGVVEARGSVSGSIPYVAPEALLGLPIDGRADLYGLGLLLHLLALGRLPFDTSDPSIAVRWHLQGPRPGPVALGRAMSERLARLVSSLMARERDERPASAAEALDLLGAPRRRVGPPPLAGRAEVAMLRLALDASRLGARRCFDLPAPRSLAARLVADARVLAQVHGLAFARIAGPSPSALGRAVLRLLLEFGTEAASLIERHRLKRALPLRLLGGLPVWDRERDGARPEGEVARAVARAVAGFLLEVSERSGLVALATPSASPVERETERILREAALRDGSPFAGRRGLLLLRSRGGPEAGEPGSQGPGPPGVDSAPPPRSSRSSRRS